jgi:hypothetical protein
VGNGHPLRNSLDVEVRAERGLECDSVVVGPRFAFVEGVPFESPVDEAGRAGDLFPPIRIEPERGKLVLRVGCDQTTSNISGFPLQIGEDIRELTPTTGRDSPSDFFLTDPRLEVSRLQWREVSNHLSIRPAEGDRPLGLAQLGQQFLVADRHVVHGISS